MLGWCDLLCSKEMLREKGKWPTLSCLEEGLWGGGIRGKETRQKALRSTPGRRKWSVEFWAQAQKGMLPLIIHVTSEVVNLSLTMGSKGASDNNIIWPLSVSPWVSIPNLVWNWCAQREGINTFETYMIRFLERAGQASQEGLKMAEVNRERKVGWGFYFGWGWGWGEPSCMRTVADVVGICHKRHGREIQALLSTRPNADIREEGGSMPKSGQSWNIKPWSQTLMTLFLRLG